MDSLVQYTYSCSNAMFKFLKDFDIEKLVADLRRIEQHAIDKDLEDNGYDHEDTESKTLWFKFGRQYCLATDIRDIERDLNGPTNRKFIIEHFKLVTEDLDPDSELRVFFS